MKNITNDSTKRILFFNRDGTIIRPLSNDILPESKKDWEFLENVEQVLLDYLDRDYVLVFVVNIPAIEGSFTTLELQNDVFEEIGKKLNAKIGENFIWFIADSKTSKYYKPSTGSFDELKKKMKINIEESTVIGNTWSDSLFASKINLPFIHASKFFNWYETVTVFVGFPASRKTTYCREFHAFDVRVCIEDIHNSMSQEYRLEWKRLYSSIEEKIITEALKYRLNIVIDRTNLDKRRRKRFLDIVNNFKNSPDSHTDVKNIKIICKHFDIPPDICKERYLKAKDWSPIEKVDIDDFFERMQSEYEKPTIDEGFDQIITLTKDFLLKMF